MTHHQLSIQARFRPEVLERVLRVTRHRGFKVCAMRDPQVFPLHTARHIGGSPVPMRRLACRAVITVAGALKQQSSQDYVK